MAGCRSPTTTVTVCWIVVRTVRLQRPRFASYPQRRPRDQLAGLGISRPPEGSRFARISLPLCHLLRRLLQRDRPPLFELTIPLHTTGFIQIGQLLLNLPLNPSLLALN